MRKIFDEAASNHLGSALAESSYRSPLESKNKIESDHFLKTEGELDVDIFQLHQSMERFDCTSFYLKIIENKDGYMNISSIPARIDSGFMEENY